MVQPNVVNLIRVLSGNQVVGLVEEFRTFEWTRPYYEPGAFRLELPGWALSSAGIVRGRTIEPPDEPGLLYLIEQIERDRDAERGDLAIVSGRDYGGMLAERTCYPTAGQTHDTQTNVSPEAAMKHYVEYNAGPSAPAVERVPRLVVVSSQNRPAGITRTYQARYQYLATLLAEIGQPVGLGWEIRLDYPSGDLRFDVIPGVDHRMGTTNPVIVSVDFETVLKSRWLTTDLGRKTFAIVLGQGEGTARVIRTVWLSATEPAGLERRVLVVDARDLTTTDGLDQRGRAKLAETQVPDSFEVDINLFGSFRYGVDWNLGDLVSVHDRGWGIDLDLRVVRVKGTLNERQNQPVFEVSLGQPWPTLSSRLASGASDGSSRT